MKKFLLSIFVALTAMINVNAQDEVTFEWGTATWSIEDGHVYEDLDDFTANPLTLEYSNPNDFAVTAMMPLSASYNLYIDDAEEPIERSASGIRMTTTISFNSSYGFLEGHKYKIEVTGAELTQLVPDPVTIFRPETVGTSTDKYTITFTIKGPELAGTFDVEESMSLAIIDQNWTPTVSALDTVAICKALDVVDLTSAKLYGLNQDGTYNYYFGADWYDGWHDGNGDFTVYWGGWDSKAGRNAPVPVYSIKMSEKLDSIFYYFYDNWTEYVPEEQTDSVSGGTVTQGKMRASQNQSMIWDWDNGDGTMTQYTRRWRCLEGEDYKASFAIVAGKKFVVINATMHFLSQDQYNQYVANRDLDEEYSGYIASGLAMRAEPTAVQATASEGQTVTVKGTKSYDEVIVSFSGFTFPKLPFATGAFDVVAKRVVNADGTISYSAPINLMINGMMPYNGTLVGTQANAEEAPVFILTLNNATTITAVFGSTEDEAKEALAAYYLDMATAINGNSNEVKTSAIYNLNGQRKQSANGMSIIKYSDGSVKKVIKK